MLIRLQRMDCILLLYTIDLERCRFAQASMIISASWQMTQAASLSWLNSNYAYVALMSLWSYDYILCFSDMVTYLVESRRGFCTFLYLACSHLPFVFLILNLLGGCSARIYKFSSLKMRSLAQWVSVVFQPSAPISLCRTYNVINTYVGILTVLCAEGIFILRAYAVWERGRWYAAYAVINIIAFLVSTTICLHTFNFLVPEPCWIQLPGITTHLDTKASSRISVAFGLLIAAELQILLFILYPTVKNNRGWVIDNCLMANLLRQNLLYFGCGFVFSLSVILAANFLSFPVAHELAECQVVIQSVMVTRMHRDFWRSARHNASRGISTDASLSTWMERTPDIV
ncbi:hypothetical protein BDR07DRAFT_856631 [Suillus spraguei]|nr:hypothetical protein BDR07DRAFT_856631 [Suillus spraguei]